LQQVLRAMGKAHEAGIVHRDLKPDNIFICHDEPEFAKVLDFGVAKVKSGDLAGSAGSRTQTGMMIGTPYYMSPEQTQAKDIDPRADLWAIAVIAFECLTGQRPFLGDSFGELVIGINTKPIPIPSQKGVVPAGFDEWFVKGTQRDRERRFQSAREMAEELAKVGGALGVGAASSLQRTRQAAVPSAVTPVVSAATPAVSAASAPPKDLQLTTGARSVTSRSVGAGAGRNPLVLALAGVAGLIVVSAAAFVALGGPRALMQEAASSAATDLPEPPPAAAALPNPAPSPQALPALPNVAAPTPSAAPLPAPSAAAAAPAAADKPEPEPEKRPSGPGKPSDGAAKKPSPATPNKPAAPAAPAPPKEWNF
jgi:serine/threonine-protein kinase